MKKYKFPTIFTVLLLLFSLSCFAKDSSFSTQVITFNGKSLAEYANVENVPNIEGTSAFALNLNTGTLIYEKNSSSIVFPASTVKLMTAIVAYENIPDLDVDIVASDWAVRNAQGANIKIEQGEVYSARELLNAVLICGANDASLVLAEYVSGSEKEFCSLMNKKALEIGAADTHYDNVTGFHTETQVTTAKDTALIARYFYGVSELFEMSNTTRYESDRIKRILTNRNYLLSRVSSDKYFYSLADGMSVGSTPEGGQCIVSTVTDSSNLTYLCVVMNSREDDDENYAYTDIRALFDFCTENFGYQTVASKSTLMSEISVKNAVDVDSFALFPDEEIKVLLPNDLDYAEDISFEKRLFKQSASAPVNKGEVFGEVVVKYKNNVSVGRAKLVSDVSLDKSNVLYFFSKVESLVTGLWFKIFAVTAIVLFLLYFSLSVYYRYFRKSKYTGNRPRSGGKK